jgi:hypothetical protein
MAKLVTPFFGSTVDPPIMRGAALGCSSVSLSFGLFEQLNGEEHVENSWDQFADRLFLVPFRGAVGQCH